MTWQRPLNRIEPVAGPEHFQSYQITAPRKTHRRRATCAEVDCPKRKLGFKAQFDVSTVAGRENALWVERGNHKPLMFGRTVEGPLVTYTFPAGQDCFDVHSVQLEREPFYVVRGGDHRGNPRGTLAQRLREVDFIDHYQNNQAAVLARLERG